MERITKDMLHKVEQYCRNKQLFQDETVIVALSGGGDSVCLLDMLYLLRCTFNITIIAAHLNHAIRDDSADRDEYFCRDLCTKLDIQLVVERLALGELKRSDTSLETAARDARQAFLKKTADACNATKIVTGHTLSDQAETLLQRILRGTGPAGLTGILPKREGTWVRPLLCFERHEIREYLDARGLSYMDDETNTDTQFMRNRIRHRLLPVIQDEFTPGIIRSLGRLAELSSIQEEWVEEQVKNAFQKCVLHVDRYKILLEKPLFVGYHTVMQQRILRHSLTSIEGADRDHDYKEIELLREHILRKYMKITVTDSVTAEADEHIISLSRSLKRYGPLRIDIPGKTYLPCDTGVISADQVSSIGETDKSHTILINRSLIEQFGSLSVGSVLKGEMISISYHNKKQRIRDLYSTAHIPTSLRDSIPVVRSGAIPVWIPGVIIADSICNIPDTSESTECLIKLEYSDGIMWQK